MLGCWGWEEGDEKEGEVGRADLGASREQKGEEEWGLYGQEWEGVWRLGKEGGSSSPVVSREQQGGGEWVVLGCWGWGDDD